MIQVEDDGICDICYQEVAVASLEELVRMEEILSQCRTMVVEKWSDLQASIDEKIQNVNLSEYAKQELKNRITEEYAFPHRDCDRNE